MLLNCTAKLVRSKNFVHNIAGCRMVAHGYRRELRYARCLACWGMSCVCWGAVERTSTSIHTDTHVYVDDVSAHSLYYVCVCVFDQNFERITQECINAVLLAHKQSNKTLCPRWCVCVCVYPFDTTNKTVWPLVFSLCTRGAECGGYVAYRHRHLRVEIA